MLVDQHRKAKAGDGDDKEIRAAIARAIDSSPSLRNKKDLIEAFVDSLSTRADVDVAWSEFVSARLEVELGQIIAEEGLNEAEAWAFVGTAFRDGVLPQSGTAITRILPPISRFGPSGGHSAKKQAVTSKLMAFYERFAEFVPSGVRAVDTLIARAEAARDDDEVLDPVAGSGSDLSPAETRGLLEPHAVAAEGPTNEE